MKGKKTKYSNVFRAPDGRLFVRVSCLIDGAKVEKRQMLDAGATERDAIRLVAELKESLVANDQALSPDIPTVVDYCDTWLARKQKRNRESVISEMKHRLEEHCLPVLVRASRDLGSLRLDEVNMEDVEEWVAWAEGHRQKSGKAYSPDTVMGWWRTLTHMLRDGVARHRLQHDPTARVTPPNVTAPRVRETKTLKRPQLEAFLAAVQAHQPLRHAELAFIAYTGCRTGEALGLHWKDLCLDGPHPRAALKFSATNGKLELTKTDAPREVPLIPKLVVILKAHHTAQLKKEQPQWDDGQGALVFPSAGESYRVEQSLAKPCRICSGARGVGQRVTPQVLRRSLNTILIAEGVDLITIRELMGHSSIKMTERYASIPLEDKAAALGRVLG